MKYEYEAACWFILKFPFQIREKLNLLLEEREKLHLTWKERKNYLDQLFDQQSFYRDASQLDNISKSQEVQTTHLKPSPLALLMLRRISEKSTSVQRFLKIV